MTAVIESNIEVRDPAKDLPQHFSTVTPITHWVSPDEKAYMLLETNVIYQKLWRRVQVIYVERGGELARYAEVMGLQSEISAPELMCPSLWVMTVAELREYADQERADDYWQRFLAEKDAESTLINDWHEQAAARREIIANRSVVGPYQRTQRHEFSQYATRDLINARRQHGRSLR